MSPEVAAVVSQGREPLGSGVGAQISSIRIDWIKLVETLASVDG
jgi:hypothetical protein